MLADEYQGFAMQNSGIGRTHEKYLPSAVAGNAACWLASSVVVSCVLSCGRLLIIPVCASVFSLAILPLFRLNNASNLRAI